MENPRVASDRTATDAYAARCRCGTSLAERAHRACLGEAAIHHSLRVEVRANLLLSRLRAIHLMGTIDGELQPLSTAH